MNLESESGIAIYGLLFLIAVFVCLFAVVVLREFFKYTDDDNDDFQNPQEGTT